MTFAFLYTLATYLTASIGIMLVGLALRSLPILVALQALLWISYAIPHRLPLKYRPVLVLSAFLALGLGAYARTPLPGGILVPVVLCGVSLLQISYFYLPEHRYQFPLIYLYSLIEAMASAVILYLPMPMLKNPLAQAQVQAETLQLRALLDALMPVYCILAALAILLYSLRSENAQAEARSTQWRKGFPASFVRRFLFKRQDRNFRPLQAQFPRSFFVMLAILGIFCAGVGAVLYATGPSLKYATLVFLRSSHIPEKIFPELSLESLARNPVTGVDDRVELGDFGDIKRNYGEALRLTVLRDGRPLPPSMADRLLLRGRAFSEFNGWRWQKGDRTSVTLRDADDGLRDGAIALNPDLPPRTRHYVATVFVHKNPSQVLFGIPTVTDVHLPVVYRNRDQTLLSPRARGERIRYTVESEVLEEDRRRVVALRPAAHPDPLYTSLPDTDQTRRIQRFTDDLLKNEHLPSDGVRAAFIEQYLKKNFGYTLEGDDTPRDQALANFLFVRKKGHCEYFATAMAVMCRTQGIPARLATGFSRAVWDPANRNFVVRGKEAHAWVEVHFEGAGWIAFDPTPAGSSEAPIYVAGMPARGFDPNEFADLAAMGFGELLPDDRGNDVALNRNRSGSALLDLLQGDGLRLAGRIAVVALGVALVLALCWIILNRNPAGILASMRSQDPCAAAVGFYEEFLRAAARLGCTRRLHETPGELAARVARAIHGDAPPPHCPAWALTRLFERTRYGGAPLADADRQQAAALVAQVKAVKPRI